MWHIFVVAMHRKPNPLNPYATLRFGKNQMQIDLVAYAAIPRVFTQPIYIDSDKSDDYEINDCVHCKKPLGLAVPLDTVSSATKSTETTTSTTTETTRTAETSTTPETTRTAETTTTSTSQTTLPKDQVIYLTAVVIVASNPKFPDATPQLVVTAQPICADCLGEKPTAPKDQCMFVSLIEFAGILHSLPNDLFQNLLNRLSDSLKMDKQVWQQHVSNWFAECLETTNFYELVWRNRLSFGQTKDCNHCTKVEENKTKYNVLDKRTGRMKNLPVKIIGKCSQCRNRFYCNKACQESDWLDHDHERWCRSKIWLPLVFLPLA